MAETRKQSFALTSVIRNIFVRNFRESIVSRCSHHVDAEVTGYPLPKATPVTAPLRRRFRGLLNSSRHSRLQDRIWAKSLEHKKPQLLSFGRSGVNHNRWRRQETFRWRIRRWRVRAGI